MIVLKAGQGDVDAFVDPAEDSGETKIPVFDDLMGAMQHCVDSFSCKAPTDIVGKSMRGFWASRINGKTSEPQLVFLKDTDTWQRMGLQEGGRWEPRGGEKTKPAKARSVDVPTMLCRGNVRTAHDEEWKGHSRSWADSRRHIRRL